MGRDGVVDHPAEGSGVAVEPATVATGPSGPAGSRGGLDYYLVHPVGGPGAGPPTGILVEEFVYGADHVAVRLDSAGWLAGEPGWRGASGFSRAIRADAGVRGRIVPVERDGADLLHRRLTGSGLPAEAALRGHLGAGPPLPTSPPLRLGGEVTPGYHDTRVYRVLFANALTPDGLAEVQRTWRMAIPDDAGHPQARVLGTARLRVGDDAYTWEVRRVVAGAAWCLDVTVDLAGASDEGVAPVLRSLTATLRRQGLVPVTRERFS
ncbi:hypothetical protein AWW66_12965 [Micromonospora rosaria]|uniref:Uncharacterized protein n=1 Tax=Micromonospora rosaria TaxID=47874 RepID=A0A136PSV6_9ACTN|nr:hypothetical protein AWW66_12965 [Micromonospora rosaria]